VTGAFDGTLRGPGKTIARGVLKLARRFKAESTSAGFGAPSNGVHPYTGARRGPCDRTTDVHLIAEGRFRSAPRKAKRASAGDRDGRVDIHMCVCNAALIGAQMVEWAWACALISAVSSSARPLRGVSLEWIEI
jgi:hypothetical protein